MPTFRYKAVRQSGDVIDGLMDAADKAEVIAKLNDDGHLPISAEETSTASFGRLLSADIFAAKALPRRQLMIVTRGLATLLGAGVELERALQIAIALADAAAVKQCFTEILADVRGGRSLADALDARTGKFPPSYVSMVRAGEAGGALEVVFQRLSDLMEHLHASREALRSALIYPIILLTMAVASVIVMITVVLPQFQPLFEGAGRELPALTRAVLAIGTAFERYWLAMALVVVGSWAVFKQALKNPAFRHGWDRTVLRVPLVGGLIVQVEVGRLTRTLGTLLGNGVPMLGALAIVHDTVGNVAIRRSLAALSERVKSGTTIADAVAEAPHFPDLAAQLMRVGEEAGRLEEMMERIATIYDQDSQQKIGRLLSLLLPVLIIILGGFIATIIASIFLAIVSVNQLVF